MTSKKDDGSNASLEADGEFGLGDGAIAWVFRAIALRTPMNEFSVCVSQ